MVVSIRKILKRCDLIKENNKYKVYAEREGQRQLYIFKKNKYEGLTRTKAAKERYKRSEFNQVDLIFNSY